MLKSATSLLGCRAFSSHLKPSTLYNRAYSVKPTNNVSPKTAIPKPQTIDSSSQPVSETNPSNPTEQSASLQNNVNINPPQSTSSTVLETPAAELAKPRSAPIFENFRPSGFRGGNNFERHQSPLSKHQSHVLHVKASSNNTLLSLTNLNGDVLVASSGGCLTGFKKAGRAGHEAAYQATAKLIEKAAAKNLSITGLELKFKGLGPGREACFKALRTLSDWHIMRISDVTPIPFNGCRPRKARRL
ncbi:30S ribosomal protein S11 [Smittium mucronatum]|uniref:30S ribosomal protein S11 n=1 Tax=Smittium mucronatum TaxID=133383 RepID=A0A1R0H5R5_9FUNG|nr:30S ribosomal protein S11 [Smittium mucronatum]